MVTCGHQFHTGDESDWLISSSATCPVDGSTTATKILQKLIRKHCKKFPKEVDEIKIQTNKGTISLKKLDSFDEENKNMCSEFSFYSQPDNNHYVISQFLQNHYRQHRELESEDDNDSYLHGKSIHLSTSRERESKLKNHKENRTKYNKGISAFYDFDNFDETQHLDGCPVKWLYRKKSVESLKNCKAATRWSIRKVTKDEKKEKKDGKRGNYRDRTPVEIKIRKMPLAKRDSLDELSPVPNEYLQKTEKHEKKRDAKEIQKKRLAAKLNWKFFAEDDEDKRSEISEKSSRDGYLPPRPLLGLRPLLSILLSPRQESSCCSVTPQPHPTPVKDDRSSSASLSIKSLDLPNVAKSQKPRTRTSYAQRFVSKTSRQPKKLQTPTQITIRLRQVGQKTYHEAKESPNVILSENLPTTKKNPSEKPKMAKYAHSLTSLCYELGNKTIQDNGNGSHEYFEQMIRDLGTEDNNFKIKRFLNSNNVQVSKSNERPQAPKKTLEKKREKENELNKESEGEFHIICRKSEFFERPGKPMK